MFYPNHLRHIADILEGLDRIEATTDADLPYLRSGIELVDNDGGKWGIVRDEIGGSWSWIPPGVST
jgi:hypothetical protein